MPNAQTAPWSERLQQETLDEIANGALQMTPDGKLHFKHVTLGFAYATLADCSPDRLILHAHDGNAKYQFDSASRLLHAGWAVD